MIFWCLFDSGNGCYARSLKKHKDINYYCVGIDRENKNDHFINLDLADYGRLFNCVLYKLDGSKVRGKLVC